MTKNLSPAAIVALKEALSKIYWYKTNLRSFLQNSLSSPTVLTTLNWSNYKRQIVSDLVDYLCRNQDKYLGDLTRLCYEICNMSTFEHLEQLDGGDQKAKLAKAAVKQLKILLEPHQQIKEEQEKIADRQRLNAEKLNANAAIQEKLENIKNKYESFAVSTNVQGRGFELEQIMYNLFELYDLDPKASFRNTGEQIDGAFALAGTEFLFEAKWEIEPIGSAELDIFASKVKRKLENTLGAFLSVNGFTEGGLSAHSSGDLVLLLLDGADLMAVLEGRIDFVNLLMRKKRHAAQTGIIYLPVHKILGT